MFLSFLCYFSFKSLFDFLMSLNILIKNNIFLVIFFSVLYLAVPSKKLKSQCDFFMFLFLTFNSKL